jgi:hypothetical protein
VSRGGHQAKGTDQFGKLGIMEIALKNGNFNYFKFTALFSDHVQVDPCAAIAIPPSWVLATGQALDAPAMSNR